MLSSTRKQEQEKNAQRLSVIGIAITWRGDLEVAPYGFAWNVNTLTYHNIREEKHNATAVLPPIKEES